MVVRWGTTISTEFNVANGVKQGEIIYPILCNVDAREIFTPYKSREHIKL